MSRTYAANMNIYFGIHLINVCGHVCIAYIHTMQKMFQLCVCVCWGTLFKHQIEQCTNTGKWVCWWFHLLLLPVAPIHPEFASAFVVGIQFCTYIMHYIYVCPSFVICVCAFVCKKQLTSVLYIKKLLVCMYIVFRQIYVLLGFGCTYRLQSVRIQCFVVYNFCFAKFVEKWSNVQWKAEWRWDTRAYGIHMHMPARIWWYRYSWLIRGKTNEGFSHESRYYMTSTITGHNTMSVCIFSFC